MESSHLIPGYPGGSDEDILASLLDAVPPAPYFDLLSLSELAPPSPSGLPLLSDINKRDRESGELEDEGFEDCIEEEESAALQRDSDPSLATTSIPLHTINTTGLDTFFPLEGGDQSNDDDVFMTTSKSLVDELFDLDQGVAMEASELPVMTSYAPTIDNGGLPDLTASLYNGSTSLPSTPPFFTLSPHTSSYNYPPPPLVPVHHMNNNGASPIPDLVMGQPTNTVTGQADNDIDYLCRLLQNPIPHEGMISPVQYKRDLIVPVSPHRTEQSLNDTLMPTPVNDYNNYIQHNPPNHHHTNTISLESINSLSLVTASNNSTSWNNTTYNRHNSDRVSPTERRSPSPSRPLPSPASSINTDYPESEFSKELPSPDVPSSLPGYNKPDIVDMPFYEFKKLIDSNSISERDKEEVKTIRKRGKNKMAAKNCRHRKLELLSSLQQDIDKLKGKKARLALKALSLQREIEGYKNRYTYSSRQQPNTHQLTATTTKVH